MSKASLFRLALALGLAAALGIDSAPAVASVHHSRAPAAGRWTVVGPEGALVGGFAVDPSDPATVYVATAGGV